MELVHRKIDFIRDKDIVLERHCKINYECDTPWKRKMPYDEYRKEWFSFENQVASFYDYLRVPFYSDEESQNKWGESYSFGNRI